MCGVVGLIGTPDASTEAFLGLTTLQHRGQDAAGILSYNQDGFHTVKNLGLVDLVFTRENMTSLLGKAAIAHARYSTVGRGDLTDVQPFVVNYPFGIGMVHNGNIVNTKDLKALLKTKKRTLLTHSDTEMILNLFADTLSTVTQGVELSFEHICLAVKELQDTIIGSYSIVALIANYGLIAFRDPVGIRPLVLGKKSDSFCLASESVALDFLGYQLVSDVAPGEVVQITDDLKLSRRVLRPMVVTQAKHCMFEWVYFASPESIIDGVPVYGSRIALGKELSEVVRTRMEKEGWNADIVVPVPETSRIAAIALSEELKISYRELLIKNRYIKRTFILDSQEKRQKAVNLKLSPVKSEIYGKRVLLVDDSIVRGTTSKKIIELVRQAGAKEVYFVSTCPPISHPCFYGIDFPSSDELIAFKRTQSEIEKELGADGVIYQSVAGLGRSIDKSLCTACIDGIYPTDTSSALGFSSDRKLDREKDSKKQMSSIRGETAWF